MKSNVPLPAVITTLIPWVNTEAARGIAQAFAHTIEQNLSIEPAAGDELVIAASSNSASPFQILVDVVPLHTEGLTQATIFQGIDTTQAGTTTARPNEIEAVNNALPITAPVVSVNPLPDDDSGTTGGGGNTGGNGDSGNGNGNDSGGGDDDNDIPLYNDINGTSRADCITGTNNADRINALAGRDVVDGRGGNDLINGDEGNDTLHGGSGDDTINGGIGNDKLYGGADSDILRGNAGKDTLKGEAGDDILIWDSADKFDGGSGFDALRAEAGVAAVFRLNSGTYKRLEKIDLNNAVEDKITLKITDVIRVSDTDSLLVTGDAGDQIISSNIGQRTVNIAIDNTTYAHFTHGQADLYIELGLELNGITLT